MEGAVDGLTFVANVGEVHLLYRRHDDQGAARLALEWLSGDRVLGEGISAIGAVEAGEVHDVSLFWMIENQGFDLMAVRDNTRLYVLLGGAK